MNGLITNIISYLNYLNMDCKLRVSAHFQKNIFRSLPQSIVSRLLPYNTHTNPYCLAVKGKSHYACMQNQKDILAQCRKDESFCNICHAGVCEYIYPIFKGINAVGFIAVSGYRHKTSTKAIVNRDLWEIALQDKEIPFELCNTIIPPLALMFEKLLTTFCDESDNEYNLILQFLNEYHTNITLSDLSNHFNRSESHISHLFKRECGMSIRAYCNILKLEDSKKLLLNIDFSITEIAFDVGFNDVSYFIYLFKKKYRVSPLQYRKINL